MTFEANMLVEDELISGNSAANVLFFDFEWLPNRDLLDSIAVHYVKPRSQYHELMVPEACVSSMVIAEFKDYLAARQPVISWLHDAAEAAGRLKGKKTVEEAILKELEKAAQGDIPSEVLFMAECQEIVTLSWAIGYGEVEQCSGSEIAICEKLAELFLQGYRPAGWAIRSSDIPMFLAACARHSVNPMRSFDLKFGSDIIDMYEIRFGRGAKGKLQDLVIATGFDCGLTDPLKDGSEVSLAWNTGRRKDVLLHNKIDILKLQHAHKHYAGILW